MLKRVIYNLWVDLIMDQMMFEMYYVLVLTCMCFFNLGAISINDDLTLIGREGRLNISDGHDLSQ